MTVRMLSAVIHKEDDIYVALCPEVGTASQGKTVEEAVANLKRMFPDIFFYNTLQFN